MFKFIATALLTFCCAIAFATEGALLQVALPQQQATANEIHYTVQSETEGLLHAQLLNMEGNIVIETAGKKILAGETDMKLRLRTLPSGTYFLRVSVNGEVVMEKVVAAE